MDIHELLKMASNAISNIASVPTVSSVVTAQHHVQQHISALQSGWGYQTALNSVQLLVDHIKLGVEVQTVAQHCTWVALQDLTHIADRHQPSEYAAALYDTTKTCFEEKREEMGARFSIYLILLLTFLVMTILLGPSWPILVPLRVIGFGNLGIRAGSLAAWLQRVLFGGFVPAGGWFATATSWGMRRGSATFVKAGSLVYGVFMSMFSANATRAS